MAPGGRGFTGRSSSALHQGLQAGEVAGKLTAVEQRQRQPDDSPDAPELQPGLQRHPCAAGAGLHPPGLGGREARSVGLPGQQLAADDLRDLAGCPVVVPANRRTSSVVVPGCDGPGGRGSMVTTPRRQ